jgi:hypothetical protein
VIGRHRQAVAARLTLVGNDKAQTEELQNELERQASSLDKQLQEALTELHTIFETLHKRSDTFIEAHLNVTRAVRGLDRDKMRAEFETEVIGTALNQVKTVSEQYVNTLVDSGRAYWRSVIDRLNKLEAMLKEEAGNLDAATYADQRAALQEALALAAGEMKSYTDNRVVEGLEDTFSQNVRGFTISVTSALSGVIAFLLSAIGGITAAHGLAIVFGVVFAPIALAGGVGGAFWFSQKAIRDARAHLNASIQTLEESYRSSLIDLTSRERTRLVQYGKQILTPVFTRLETLAQRYRDQQSQLDSFAKRADEIENAINSVVVQPQPQAQGA